MFLSFSFSKKKKVLNSHKIKVTYLSNATKKLETVDINTARGGESEVASTLNISAFSLMAASVLNLRLKISLKTEIEVEVLF